MEKEKNYVTLEKSIAESNKKIEDLTSLLQKLSNTVNPQDISDKTNVLDVLNKIESKLDKFSQEDHSDFVGIFVSELRKSLNEKQKFISSKMLSIEELNKQISELLKRQDGQDKDIVLGLSILKTEINKFSEDFNEIQDNIDSINEKVSKFASFDGKNVQQIKELSSFVENLKPLFEKIDMKLGSNLLYINEKFEEIGNIIKESSNAEFFEAVKSDIDSVNLAANAVMSAISVLDVKYKDYDENISKLSKLEGIDQIQNSLSSLFEQISLLDKSVKEASTADDISQIRQLIEKINFEDSFLRENLNYVIDIAKLLDAKIGDGIEDILKKAGESNNNAENILAKVESANENIEILEDKFEKVVNQLIGFVTEYEEIKYSLTAVSENSVAYSNLLQEVLSKTDSSSKDLSSLANFKDKLSEDIQDLKINLENINKNTIDTNPVILEFKDYLTSLYANNSSLLEKNTDLLSAKIDDISSSVYEENEQIKSKLDGLNEKLSFINNYLDRFAQLKDFAPIKDDIKGMSSKVIEIKDHLDKLPTLEDDDRIKVELATISDKISSLNEVLGFILDNTDVEDLKNNFKQIFIVLSELESNINSSVQGNNKEIKQEIDTLVDKLAIIKESFDSLASGEGIESIKIAMSAVWSKIMELEGGLNKFLTLDDNNLIKREISSVSDKIDSLNVVLKSISNNNDAQDLKDNFSQAFVVLSELEENLNNLIKENTSITCETINNINSSLLNESKEIKQEMSSLTDKLDDLKESVEFFNNTEPIEEATSSIKSKIEELKEGLDKLAFLGLEVELIHSSIGKIPTLDDNNQIRQDILRISDKINSLNETLDSVSRIDDIRDIHDAVKAISSEFSGLEENFNSLIKENIKIYEKLNEFNNSLSNENMQIKQDVCSISEELIGLRKSLDHIATTNDTEQIKANILYTLSRIDEIKDGINNFISIESKIDSIGDNVEKLPTHETINIIQGSIAELSESLDFLNKQANSVFSKSDIECVKENISQLDSKLIEMQHNIDSLVSSNLNLLEKENSEIGEKLEDINLSIIDESKNIEESKQEIKNLSEKLASFSQMFGQLPSLDDLSHAQESIDKLRDHIDFSLSENTVSLKENLSGLNNKFEELMEVLAKDSDDSKFPETANLSVQLDELGKILEKLSSVDDLNRFHEAVDSSISKINELGEENLDKLTYLNSEIESVQEILGKVPTIENVEIIRDEILSLQSDVSDLKERLQKLPSNNDTDKVKEYIDFSLAENSTSLKEDFKSLSDKFEDLLKFFINEDNNESSSQDIKDSLQKLEINLENIDESLINLKAIDEIKESINNLSIEENIEDFKTELNHLINRLSGENEFIKGEIFTLQEKIENFANLVEPLSKPAESDENLENSELVNSDNTEAVLKSIELLTQQINSLEDVFDDNKDLFEKLNNSEFTDTIRNEINNIKEQVALQVAQAFDNISFVEESEDLKGFIEATENTLLTEIASLREDLGAGEISSRLDSFEDTIENSVKAEFETLKSNIAGLKTFLESVDFGNYKDLTSNLELIFDSMKLINGRVSENTETSVEEIKKIKAEFKTLEKHINNTTNSKLDNISSQTTQFVADSEQIKIRLADIIQGIENISKLLSDSNQIEIINNNFLNLKVEFQKLTDKLEGLSSDLATLGAKSNKLLISSTSDRGLLEKNLSDFRDMLSQGSGSNLTEVGKKLDKINKSTVISSQNSEIIKEALLQVAEWIDGAGNLIEETNSNISDIKSKTSGISEEISNISDAFEDFEKKVKGASDGSLVLEDIQAQIEKSLNQVKKDVKKELSQIDDKFSRFEEKLENIEAKLGVTGSGQGFADEEIRSILEFIASQASAANENSKANAANLKRMEVLEKRMASFDASMKRLVSLVNEE